MGIRTPESGDSFMVEQQVAGQWYIRFLILFLVAWPAMAAEPPGAAMQDVQIGDAWVRAMPPSQASTAAYMTVHNSGNSELVITGATSDAANRVEIHTSRQVDGMVRMERLEQVPLAPGQVIEFAPGGMHLMILGLEKMPAPGEQVKLCLEFMSGASSCTEAGVRRVAPSPDDKMHHNHQHH